MRLIEILILVTDGLIFLWPALTARRPRWVAYLPALASALVALHLLVEKYRWQMIPAYALTVLLFLLGLRPPAAPRPRRWTTFAGSALGVLLVLLLALPGVLFPVPVLPTPSGPYRVGTFSLPLTDAAREEIYTDAPNDKRELMMQVWYPATPAPNAPLAPWMERLDAALPAMANYIHLPPFMLSHVGLIRTHAYLNAPLASDPATFPLLVYSHGWNGFRTVHDNLMEELASHGYVVAALDHTYGAMVTVFADGRVAFNNPAALPDGSDVAGQILEATYAADVRFALDSLEALNTERFAGRLDFSRVGLLGHSTGGGAVVQACALDARCQAGLGMDAWLSPVPPAIIGAGLSQPFMFMRSEVWASEKNDALLNQLLETSTNARYRLTLAGTRHYDFSVLPLLTPLAPALKLKGPLPAERVLGITSAYVLAFFDEHLKGAASPLLSGPAALYPEVMFEKRGP